MTDTKKPLKMTKTLVAIKQNVDSLRRCFYLADQLASINGMFGIQLNATSQEANYFAGVYKNQLKEFQSLPQPFTAEELSISAQTLSECFDACSAQLSKLNIKAQEHKKLSQNAKVQLTKEYEEVLKQLLTELKIDPNKIGRAPHFDATLAEYISRALDDDRLSVSSSDGGTFILIANRKLSKKDIVTLSTHAGIDSDKLSALPVTDEKFTRFRMRNQGLFNFIVLTKLRCVDGIFTRLWSA